MRVLISRHTARDIIDVHVVNELRGTRNGEEDVVLKRFGLMFVEGHANWVEVEEGCEIPVAYTFSEEIAYLFFLELAKINDPMEQPSYLQQRLDNVLGKFNLLIDKINQKEGD